MMPDLGDFAVEVLAAYGVSIVLLVWLTVVSIRRARKLRRQLAEVEARKERADV